MLVRKSCSSRLVAPKSDEGGSEGVFKGIVVLPVREIGELILGEEIRRDIADQGN